MNAASPNPHAPGRIAELFLVFLRLGLTSFGGPVAHLGYFRAELVEKRGWMTDESYADLVALCQVLPGPASSQVGMGLIRAGGWGLIAAWLGFTLPSALLMFAFALTLNTLGTLEGAGWLAGLKVAALAVVAQAVSGMARTLTPDAPRLTLAGMVAALILVFPYSLVQPLSLLLAGLIGWRWLKIPEPMASVPTRAAGLNTPVSRRVGAALLLLTLGLLLLLLAASGRADLHLLSVFMRAGALVFGGGHVVLPLLQAGLVPQVLDASTFVAGYGAVQAMPGPLFTFASYLGAAARTGLNPGYAALVATVGIFLLAALYTPVFTSAVQSGHVDNTKLALALAASLALTAWNVPPWAVVLACAGAGFFVL